MKIVLLDYAFTMVACWKQAFSGTDVECVCDDFAAFMDRCGDEVSCIVSPANSYGLMDGGFDLALTRYFGEDLPKTVQTYIRENYHGEQPVGTSFLLPIPSSRKHLIHTPTMRIPSQIIDSMVVYHAMRSTLLEAIRHNVQSIVIPAFGGRCGCVPKDVIAQSMRMAYDQIFSPAPEMLTWDYAQQRFPEELRERLTDTPESEF